MCIAYGHSNTPTDSFIPSPPDEGRVTGEQFSLQCVRLPMREKSRKEIPEFRLEFHLRLNLDLLATIKSPWVEIKIIKPLYFRLQYYVAISYGILILACTGPLFFWLATRYSNPTDRRQNISKLALVSFDAEAKGEGRTKARRHPAVGRQQ